MEVDLTESLIKERKSGSLKTLLLDVYRAQEDLIISQQAALVKLVNENLEQENFISELMHSNA